MVGEKVTLPCVATSAEGTHLSYLWTRNGIPLDVDGERLFYASNETGTVVINGTEVRDTGLYQCIVETTFSRVPSQVFITNSTLSDVTVSCEALLSLINIAAVMVQIHFHPKSGQVVCFQIRNTRACKLKCFMTPLVYCPSTLHIGGFFYLEHIENLYAVISNTKVHDGMLIACKLHSSERCF